MAVADPPIAMDASVADTADAPVPMAMSCAAASPAADPTTPPPNATAPACATPAQMPAPNTTALNTLDALPLVRAAATSDMATHVPVRAL